MCHLDNRIVCGQEEIMSEEPKTFTEKEAQKHFGISLNGQVWELLAKEDRTRLDDELMVQAAHGSLYFWLLEGTAVNQQRGEWMISRVYSELGLAHEALRHAAICNQLTEDHGDAMEDFDKAYALEALARANAIAGNRDEALRYYELAAAVGAAIADDESKKYFVGDLAGGPWAGVR
jgi:hypothetical protein